MIRMTLDCVKLAQSTP